MIFNNLTDLPSVVSLNNVITYAYTDPTTKNIISIEHDPNEKDYPFSASINLPNYRIDAHHSSDDCWDQTVINSQCYESLSDALKAANAYAASPSFNSVKADNTTLLDFVPAI